MYKRRKGQLKIISNLQNKGIPVKKPNQLKAPIGLDIGAKTPQEIAISILAEILSKV